jgi:hypothetical protein
MGTPGLDFETWASTNLSQPSAYTANVGQPVSPPGRGPLRLNLNHSFQSGGVMAVTRPRLVLRPFCETALDRIAMHVTRLLHPLLLVMGNEAIMSRLPEQALTI